MLNYFTHLTNFKHFRSSTCLHLHIQSHDMCGQHKAGDWILTCEHVEDPKCLKFVRYFCFYSAPTKTSFGFCSCSELLQPKFGEEKKLCMEIQMVQPPKPCCKWKIFAISTTLWKGSNENFSFLLGVKVAEI